jgi:hypothetical protein
MLLVRRLLMMIVFFAPGIHPDAQVFACGVPAVARGCAGL